MGSPRKLKNHYISIKRPWDSQMLEDERKLKNQYGLKTKREIRKIEYIWKSLRQRGRKLVANKDPKEIKILFKKINDYGLFTEEANLENILDLKLIDVLERRLQNIVFKLGIGTTQLHARQLIVHRNIKINNVIIFSPNYIVKKHEENHIVLVQKSKKTKPTEKDKKETEKTKEVKESNEKKETNETKESEKIKETKETEKINTTDKSKDLKKNEQEAKK